MAPETMTALVTFERGGREHYSNIRVNGVRVGQSMEDLPGASTGEFGTALIGIFHPASHATFSFRGESALATGTMLVYDFRVLRENNAVWYLKTENNRSFPGYHGSVWVEKDNGLLRRLELKAADSEIDPALPLISVDLNVDYAFTQLSELGIYLLPVGSETYACTRNSKCSRSVLEFRNCHKFAAKTRILPDSKP